MSRIADGLIRFYQRHLSARKGFTCALAVREGGISCSEAVRRIVQRRGVLKGLPEIRRRFKACHDAAVAMRDNPLLVPQHAIDCDFIGCDGCGDTAVFDSCSGDGEGSGNGSRIPVIVLPVCLTAILLVLLWLGWGYAHQVVAVEIRLVDGGSEYTDGRLSGLLGGEQPDYQVVLKSSGRTVSTETLRDTSAAEWIELRLDGGIGAVDELLIIDQEPVGHRVLGSVSEPEDAGRAGQYEYRIHRRLDLF